MNRRITLSTLFVFSFITAVSAAASADKLCTKFGISRGTVTVSKRTVASSARCPRGFSNFLDTGTLSGPAGTGGAAGATGATGAAGPTGATGTDGAFRVWGNGSTGTVTFSSNQVLEGGNYQFGNFSVAAGTTLTVRSGTIIRATGTCTIDGNISVTSSSSGGFIRTPTGGSTLTVSIVPAVKGLGFTNSSNGEYGSNSAIVLGANGGISLLDQEAVTILKPVLHAGGAGGPALGGVAGVGGGSVALYCQGAIVVGVGGTVVADGSPSVSPGGGGAAGGLIILASAASIVNSGTLQANGGIGGASSNTIGAGGGGGGGVINMVAPSITAGTINTVGGAAGNNAVAVTVSPRFGGSSGGSFGGGGGAGGSVSIGNASTALSGNSGKSNSIIADPTALLL